MGEYSDTFVGIDVAKGRNAIAIISSDYERSAREEVLETMAQLIHVEGPFALATELGGQGAGGEGCRSGRTRRFRKALYTRAYRGFESHSLRHAPRLAPEWRFPAGQNSRASGG
jgi:hypothetical protein